MPRTRQITLSAVNVKTHPHSTNEYIELFKMAGLSRDPITIAGEKKAILGPVFSIGEKVLTGEVLTFTELNPDLEWIDTERAEEATEEQIGSIRIPEGLQPNFKRIRYFFFAKEHRLIFVRRDGSHSAMSADRMCSFLTSLLNSPDLLKSFRFNSVVCDVIQGSDSFDRIFSDNIVHELLISVDQPNSDFPSFRAEIEKEHEEERIRRKEIRLIAKEGESIQPSERTKALIGIANDDGYTSATVTDVNGRKKRIESKKHPVEEQYQLDIKENVVSAIGEFAKQVLEKIMKS